MNESKKSVYIETTIPSLATGRPSRSMLTLHRQDVSKLWWEYERHKYNIFTSQYVTVECSRGDREAAQRRLEFIKDIPLIPKNNNVDELAEKYYGLLQIPERAKTDCAHLAVCVDAKIHYLLSWNCTHLGVDSYAKVYEYNKRHDLWIPRLVTPEMLMELEEEENELS